MSELAEATCSLRTQPPGEAAVTGTDFGGAQLLHRIWFRGWIRLAVCVTIIGFGRVAPERRPHCPDEVLLLRISLQHGGDRAVGRELVWRQKHCTLLFGAPLPHSLDPPLWVPRRGGRSSAGAHHRSRF